jgi:antitoxin MazE
MKTQLRKWGNSVAVRIPKPVADAAKLRAGDHLELKVAGPGTVQLRRAKAKPTLAQLVRGIAPENRHAATDWGRPVGNESW